MNRYFFFTLIICLMFTGVIQLIAQVPRTLSYQGVLSDTTGNPKPDGSYNLVFRMYDVASGGTALWSESETVATKRGLFSSILGDGTVFPSSMKFDEQYWLSIQVDAPPELSPRIPLTAVGYSMHSISADTAYVTITSIGDTLWKRSGSNIYRATGNVGIGTSNPSDKLHLIGQVRWQNPNGNVVGVLSYDTAADLLGIGSSIGGYESAALSLWAGGLERVRLDQSGNVGIGTTNPTSLFHLVKNQNLETVLSLDNSDPGSNARTYFYAGEDISKRGAFGYTNSGFSPIVGQELVTANSVIFNSETQVYNGIRIIAASPNAPIIFGTGGYASSNERMRILSNGNIGIGTTTPGYKLDVNGDLNLSAGSVYRIGGVAQTGSSKWTQGTGDNIYRLNGNVGIGTTTPEEEIHIAGFSDVPSDSRPRIRIENLNTSGDNGTAIGFEGRNTFFAIGTDYNRDGSNNLYIADAIANVPRLQINSLGFVGIGTTNPVYRLHVSGGIRVDQNPLGSCLVMADQSNVVHWQQWVEPSDHSLRFWAGGDTGVDRVIITQEGKVGIGPTIPSATLEIKVGGTTLADAWSARSSRRWKTNIRSLESSLEKVEKLQGVSFNWKESGKSDIGLIAEEVGEIVPEVVTFEDNGIDAKSIDYAKLVALLIEGMKDQQKQIEELKAELNSLNPKPTE